MKIAITIQHPAHVHFFRNAIAEFTAAGHEIRVFVREKDVAIDLLEAYEIPHKVLAGAASSARSLPKIQAVYEARLWWYARRFQPDVITAIGGVAAAHVARLVGARSVIFYDTEHATLSNALAYPFAHRICTPERYQGAINGNHVRYPGYHELAYLHPDRFTPDPTVLDEIEIKTDSDGEHDEQLVVLRLVAWNAAHDIGAKETGLTDIHDAIDRLEATGARVLITSEASPPADLEKYRMPIAPHRMHDLLYYTDVFIGENSTMAREAAVLGTPALCVSSLRLGYTDELKQIHGLLRTFDRIDRHENALQRAVSILEADNQNEWKVRRALLLEEKVDTTDVIVREITNEGEKAHNRSLTHRGTHS